MRVVGYVAVCVLIAVGGYAVLRVGHGVYSLVKHRGRPRMTVRIRDGIFKNVTLIVAVAAAFVTVVVDPEERNPTDSRQDSAAGLQPGASSSPSTSPLEIGERTDIRSHADGDEVNRCFNLWGAGSPPEGDVFVVADRREGDRWTYFESQTEPKKVADGKSGWSAQVQLQA